MNSVKLCFTNQVLWFGTAKSYIFPKFSFFLFFPLPFPSPSPNPLISPQLNYIQAWNIQKSKDTNRKDPWICLSISRDRTGNTFKSLRSIVEKMSQLRVKMGLIYTYKIISIYLVKSTLCINKAKAEMSHSTPEKIEQYWNQGQVGQ